MLTKRPSPPKLQTWCGRCKKPFDWWTMVPDGQIMRGGQYDGVATPVLSVGCHGDVFTIGCSPEPDVLASWWPWWEEFRAGRILEIFVPSEGEP